MNKTDPNEESAKKAAAEWLARRDRGLSPAEQDAYLQWLREHPERPGLVAGMERSWCKLDRLAEWRPAHSPRPNADLLAVRRPTRWWPAASFAAAAAAVAIACWFVWPATETTPSRSHAVLHPAPERMMLDDGSVVDVNRGARVRVQFSPTERRVVVASGEVHFSVAKDPNRPFVVVADQVQVRAVGTAFAVNTTAGTTAVLVTEGKVQVDAEPSPSRKNVYGSAPSYLVAGQQARCTYDPAAGTVRVDIEEVTPSQIERVLAWKYIRLEFADSPLSAVVQEFNRYNSCKLQLADSRTGEVLVGGSFRADNVEAFVRLLDAGFDIGALHEGAVITLKRRN